MRILLVEDTRDVGEGVAARLQRAGHTVDWSQDGAEADAILAVQPYDLVILDVMVPGMDGFAVLRRLRDRRQRTAVLMLTARSQVEDRVSALDLGADDYLVKPFDPRELEARVRVLLRRGAGSATNQLVCGDVVLEVDGRTVTVGGLPVELTRRETALLEVLAARPGQIVEKVRIQSHLFGLDDNAGLNAVEQYVARLRRKLAGARAEIRTLRGLGYQLIAR